MDGSSLKLLFEILKEARLLIDLFAKIAVSSILIVCTKTGIPNYFPNFKGHFCLLNQEKCDWMLSNFQPHTLFYQKRNSIHTPLILKDKMSHNFWTEFGNSSHSLVGKISRAQHTFAEITPLNSSHG